MARWLASLKKLSNEQDGASAVEYAFLAFFIAALIVSVVIALGQGVIQLFIVSI
jgi:Flp pilus assembly pilin Flp